MIRQLLLANNVLDEYELADQKRNIWARSEGILQKELIYDDPITLEGYTVAWWSPYVSSMRGVDSALCVGYWRELIVIRGCYYPDTLIHNQVTRNLLRLLSELEIDTDMDSVNRRHFLERRSRVDNAATTSSYAAQSLQG